MPADPGHWHNQRMSRQRGIRTAVSWRVHPAVVYLVAVTSFLVGLAIVLSAVSWVYPWLLAYGVIG